MNRIVVATQENQLKMLECLCSRRQSLLNSLLVLSKLSEFYIAKTKPKQVEILLGKMVAYYNSHFKVFSGFSSSNFVDKDQY